MSVRPRPVRRSDRSRGDGWQVFTDFRTEHAFLGSLIAEASSATPVQVSDSVQVLEAGCGQRWPIDVPGTSLHITGVDLDPEAMRIRSEETGDLDRAIVGDLRTVDLPAAAFDVAYCSFVLEHVDGAELVLDRLRAATRPGGLIIIRVPDRDTVYGFAVRHSPHRLHVLYKRHVEGFPDAGKPGHAPYPAVYERVVSLPGLQQYAEKHGLEVVEAYGSSAYLNVFGRIRPLVQLVLSAVGRLSLGRLYAGHNNLGVVYRRPGV
ncbi:MAG: class I SAM-dependent methyltransferase [Propionibacteriaceae bacterium]